MLALFGRLGSFLLVNFIDAEFFKSVSNQSGGQYSISSL